MKRGIVGEEQGTEHHRTHQPSKYRAKWQVCSLATIQLAGKFQGREFKENPEVHRSFKETGRHAKCP